jgi:hypothetical protein
MRVYFLIWGGSRKDKGLARTKAKKEVAERYFQPLPYLITTVKTCCV